MILCIIINLMNHAIILLFNYELLLLYIKFIWILITLWIIFAGLLTLFIILTDFILPFDSIIYINNEVNFGYIIRLIHYYWFYSLKCFCYIILIMVVII